MDGDSNPAVASGRVGQFDRRDLTTLPETAIQWPCPDTHRHLIAPPSTKAGSLHMAANTLRQQIVCANQSSCRISHIDKGRAKKYPARWPGVICIGARNQFIRRAVWGNLQLTSCPQHLRPCHPHLPPCHLHFRMHPHFRTYQRRRLCHFQRHRACRHFQPCLNDWLH